MKLTVLTTKEKELIVRLLLAHKNRLNRDNPDHKRILDVIPRIKRSYTRFELF